jgi:sarcosine oxidase
VTHYDVIVAGLGAMGSAAAYHLARRGARVLGLDRHAPPHTLGSSHGRTRIIREAYFEHPLYVPLVRRAYENWDALERDVGERLFVQSGGLMIGPEDGALVRGALAAARAHDVPHELLDAREARRRFPAFAVPDEQVALLEHRAGLLLPEACIRAHLALAERHGAELRTETPVDAWREDGALVRVATPAGELTADRLVLAAGPWMPELLRATEAPLALPLVVERQLSLWFAPRANPETLRAERCPVMIWEHGPGPMFFSLGDLGDGVKCGAHHDGVATDPWRVDRAVHDDEPLAGRAMLARILPDAAGPLRDARVCLYTNTPDGHFVLDRHPAHPRVVLASPCSGHGFKFASAIGEVLAELVLDGASRFDLSPFAVSRLTGA